MHLSDLGTCDKIVVDADETVISPSVDFSAHIESLKQKGDDESQLRLSWLTTKTAILKLGANSETDLSYKLLKCHDAIRSSALALKYGIVKGGGSCLANIIKDLPNTEAGKIMYEALKAPFIQIAKNSGFVGEIYTQKEIPENIMDASMVIKMAVRNAIGIASTILTANGIVYLPEEPKKEEQKYAF